MMNNAIKLTNLTKSFDDFKIDHMNLTIPKGYITGFIGPNGAGKSTTIKLIMDLLKADNGKIDILGYDHQKEGKKARGRIGFVYAENVYYEHLTVDQTEKLVSGFYPKWDHSIFQNLCQLFDLPQNKKVKDLSTGMKVKLALAIALSHHADLIILDEPTCGSGSLLLQMKKQKVKIEDGYFGQEINLTNYNLARMNMFLHNINYNDFSIKRGDTLTNPLHSDEKPFDAIKYF